MEFIVARNPDAASNLPFLLFLPIDGGLWLKAKESWPRSARVYCHLAEAPRAEIEILERVIATACVRRGQAIDLVLARTQNRRSQFVQTTFKGRSMILWQTPKVATTARPGVRIPFSRTPGVQTILRDTRERYGFTFGMHGVTVVRQALRAGDYGIETNGSVVASVERKTLDDLCRSLVDGTLNYAMADLAQLRCAAVVVEGTYSALLRHQYTRTGYLPELIARLQTRYPNVPIVFLESRRVAEEWTFRFLKAAQSEGVQAPLLSALIPAVEPARKPRRSRKAKAARAEN